MVTKLFIAFLLDVFILACYSKDIPVNDYEAPFLWGTATAAYQVEGATNLGGRGPSIWDTFSEIPGKIRNGDTGRIADGSYYRVQEDIQLIKNMGLKSYRFSISWSRIMSTGEYPVNEEGIAHYNFVIDELVKAGIEPLVTLYHWDLPAALDEKYGGWLSPRMEDVFKAYADVCFQAFGDRVKLWLTLNEPWTFVVMGYVAGIFAPGRCSDRSICVSGNSSTEGYIATHNALNAHAAAVELYRIKYQKMQGGRIGIALNQDFGVPLTSSEPDVLGTQVHNEFYMGWFADPIFFGKYPDSMVDILGDRLPKFTHEQAKRIRGSVDFHAFNHYTTKYIYDPNTLPAGVSPLVTSGAPKVVWGGWFDDQGVRESKYSTDGQLIGEQGASPWLQMVPWGFYEVIMWNTRRYTINGKAPVMYITENGCDVLHETEMSITEALNDDFRVRYYSEYIKQMGRAIDDGADIRGYMAWSLMDNFEWIDGYDYRFGLHYVDFNNLTLPRYPKKSAKWYSAFTQANQYFNRRDRGSFDHSAGTDDSASSSDSSSPDSSSPDGPVQQQQQRSSGFAILLSGEGILGFLQDAIISLNNAPLYGAMGYAV